MRRCFALYLLQQRNAALELWSQTLYTWQRGGFGGVVCCCTEVGSGVKRHLLMYKILYTRIFIYVVYVGYCRVFWSNSYGTNTYWSLGSHMVVIVVAAWMPWLQAHLLVGGVVRGVLWSEAARYWCACWLSWLAAGLATVLNMADSDGAVGSVWLAGCCVSRQCWVPGSLGAESGIASAELWSAQSMLGSMAMQSNNVTRSWCVADWLLLLLVGLRGLLLYCAPAVPPALPLVSRQSCRCGPVNGYRLESGPQKGHFAKAGYSLLWFDCWVGYRLVAYSGASCCLAEWKEQ
jgi:hypothetical protein